jgi:hypothetical protein
MATPRRLITGVKARIHLDQRTRAVVKEKRPVRDILRPSVSTPARPAAGRRRAKGRRRLQVGMNKTEAIYAEYLELRKLAGEIQSYAFEAYKLRLAAKTFYTPDFAVLLADDTLEFHEVKGHWEDDARVKIKVAAEIFPHRFVAVQRKAGQWKFEEF